MSKFMATWQFLALIGFLVFAFYSLDKTIRVGFLDIWNKLEEMHPTENDDDEFL